MWERGAKTMAVLWIPRGFLPSPARGRGAGERADVFSTSKRLAAQALALSPNPSPTMWERGATTMAVL